MVSKEQIVGDTKYPGAALAELFGGAAGRGTLSPEVRAWAEQHLAAVGVDPRAEPLKARTVLRQADPRMTLPVVTYVVRQL